MGEVLDTRSVAPADRRDYWSAGNAEHFFRMRIEAVGAPSFEARLTGGAIGPVAVRSIRGVPHRVVRTQQMIAAADPECILLYVLAKGLIVIEQDDRSCVLQPGDIACQDTTRPSTFEGRDAFEVLAFSIPKWFIGTEVGRIAQRTATRAVGGEGRLMPLAAPFLTSLARTAAGGAGLSNRDGEGAAEMLVPMLRSLYAEEKRSDVLSRSESLLTRMQRYVMEHLCDPELGPEQVAQAHFVSTRYVHKLFAASGSGVSATIRERRLEGAAGDLRESAWTISAIAEKWGYNNTESFSRAFREMYGYAPREFRRAGSTRSSRPAGKGEGSGPRLDLHRSI